MSILLAQGTSAEAVKRQYRALHLALFLAIFFRLSILALNIGLVRFQKSLSNLSGIALVLAGSRCRPCTSLVRSFGAGTKIPNIIVHLRIFYQTNVQ